MKIVISWFFVFILMFSCSNDDAINQDVLSGMVLGESFTALGGMAIEEEDRISIYISSEVANCDSDISTHDSFIFFELPLGTGPFLNTELEFSGNGKNTVDHDDATIIISSIKESTITVEIIASQNDDNSIEGIFTVPFCNDEEI